MSGARAGGAAELHAWLLAMPSEHDASAFLGQLCDHLLRAGVPLVRAYTYIITADPETFVENLRWNRGAGVVAEAVGHGVLRDRALLTSPVYALAQGLPELRRRLDDDAAREYSALGWLRDQGATDYLGLRLPQSGVRVGVVTFATDAPAGFDDDALALLRSIVPALALRMELLSALHIQRSLMEVYLGRQAAGVVLAGEVRRGRGRVLDAAILWTDLRGFTALSDQRPLAETVALLDRYFERAVDAVAQHGGDVLKLIGDAMLAVFPVDHAGDDAGAGATAACTRALAAAQAAQAAMAALRTELAAAGAPPLHMGLALHVGEVLFGNVGGRRRLDFTVIGPPVNEACRVEGLCKPLGQPVLATEAFARAAGLEKFVALGRHLLDGVEAPVAIFAPRPA